MSKCCWKNDTDRLTPHRIATNLQFVKKKKNNPKQNKPKHKQKTHTVSAGRNKMRYGCISLRCVVCSLKKDSSSSLEITITALGKSEKSSQTFFFPFEFSFSRSGLYKLLVIIFSKSQYFKIKI